MKIFGLKSKSSKKVSIKSLRPSIFDSEGAWLKSLFIFFLIIFVTGILGFWLFYISYSGGYKREGVPENFENLLDVDKLKKVAENRINSVSEDKLLPEDPSI